MTYAGKWRGVRWMPVRRGRCTKHGTPVGPISRLCIKCHKEQLAAAQAGSREWERQLDPID